MAKPRAYRFLIPVLLLLMTSSAAAVQRTAASDPCRSLRATLSKYALPSSKSPYVFARPSQVRPCTQSVTFSKTREQGNLNSVINYFRSFYGLLQVAKRSPDPRLSSKYDVIARLQSVGKRQWKHAEDFYAAVGKAVDGLQDGHTGISLNCPPFLHRLALPLVGVVEKGLPTVYTAPKAFLKQVFIDISKSSPFKFNPSTLAGAKVLRIENQTAWTYMRSWAAKNSDAFHTAGQQLNYAFARLNWYNGTRTSSYGTFGIRKYNPKKDYIVVTLSRSGQKAQDVKIPFISYADSGGLSYFRNKGTYFNNFCAAAPSGTASFAAPRTPPNNPLLREGRIKSLPSALLAGARDAAPQALKQGKDVTPGGLYWQVYKLNDKKTSVVTLSTFKPDLPIGTTQEILNFVDFFLQNTYDAFQLANEVGSRVLVDVSSNGGGLVAFYPLVLEFLIGSTRFKSLGSSALNPWNMLAETDVVKKLRDANIGKFNYSGYYNLQGQHFTSSTRSRFFYPIVKGLRFGPKGVRGDYSSRFKNSLLTLEDLYDQSFSPAFGSKPWAIFSDGLCFSTCSEFVTTLNLRFGVPVVAVGGIPGQPLVYSAAGGGFVVPDVATGLLTDFPPSVAALKDAPKAFTLGMSMGMRFANGYLTTNTKGSINMSAPIEFLYAATKERINYSMANIDDPTQQYQEAANAVFR